MASAHRTLATSTASTSPRGTARALFTAALMDATCPPSTVFAAFNRYAGPKEIAVWECNGHGGGAIEDELLAIAHFRTHLCGSEN